MLGLFIIGGGLFVLAALVFIFWIWMIVDCAQNTRLSSNEKIVWILVIIFLYGLGALIYFLVGRNKT